MTKRKKALLCHLGSCLGLTFSARLFGSSTSFTDWKHWVGLAALLISAEIYGYIMQMRKEVIAEYEAQRMKTL